MTQRLQSNSVPTRDPKLRRLNQVWKDNGLDPAIPNHTSYGFDDNQSKYFQRLEDWIKTYAFRLKEFRNYINRQDQQNETIRALEARVRELENRADAAGI